jgi:predicted ABC-class ATPase
MPKTPRNPSSSFHPPHSTRETGDSATGLRGVLHRIDGAPYGAYREILGTHRIGEFSVHVDRVPADPFAGLARVRVRVERDKARIPAALAATRCRRIGVEDCLARAAEVALGEPAPRPSAPPGSGRIAIEPCGPAVLERSACRITDAAAELRVLVDLPAMNRRVRGLQAEELFFRSLERFATSTLLFSQRRLEDASRAADLCEDHAAIQHELERRGLVAFVADGSLLARAGGRDRGPRRDGREVPFEAPDSLAVRLDLPRAGPVRGMGIPAGVTLIVGGGFHGKSTLLDAIASGVHPHPEGDGRERVACIPDAVVIRAEDGRAVRRVDISAFMAEMLPLGEPSADFSTEHASGSTSQAAAISESLEIGARLLLLDEDTCATNFMIRDGRMQRLVPRSGEPIVPFLDRVRDLYERFGVSTLLVTGGSGDYLEAADTVILMNRFRAEDVTSRAKSVAESTRSMRLREKFAPLRPPAARVPVPDESGAGSVRRVGLRGPHGIRIGDETVDLSALEQLVEPGQMRALALLLRSASKRMDEAKTVAILVRELDAWLDEAGLDAVDAPIAYDLARPRRHEIAAALNRWRALRVRRPDR